MRIGNCIVTTRFEPYDIWVGVYVQPARDSDIGEIPLTFYVCPLPCCLIKIQVMPPPRRYESACGVSSFMSTWEGVANVRD